MSRSASILTALTCAWMLAGFGPYTRALAAAPDEFVTPLLGTPVLVNRGRDLRLNVSNPDTNWVYELQWRADLNPDTPWQRLQLGYLGQTNFVVRTPTNPQSFLRVRLPALVVSSRLTLPEDTSAPLTPPIHVQLPTGRAQLTLSVTNGTLRPDPLHQPLVGLSPGGKRLTVAGESGTLRSILAAVRYQPKTNYFGQDHLSVTLSSGDPAAVAVADSVGVTIVVTPVNDAPVARPDLFLAREDDTLFVSAPGVLANDDDVEGGLLTTRLVMGPEHGSLAFEPNGAFVYLPDVDFSGRDRFFYCVSDGENTSASAAVELVIGEVEEPLAIRIEAPSEGVSLPVSRPVPLHVAVSSAAAHGISRVDYFSGSRLLATGVAPSFAATWAVPSLGRHILEARAVGLSGQTIESPEVTIFIAPDCDSDGVSDVEENRQGTDPCAPASSAWARLRIVSGNFQWAPPATVLPRAVTLRLSDASGRGYPNAGVYFSSFAGDVLLALEPTGPWHPSLGGVTDEEGQVRLWITAPPTAGRLGVIRASSTNGPSAVTIVATALGSLPGWTFEDVPVAVAAGGAHSLALLASGTVRAWGANLSGQLGEGIEPLEVPFSAVPLPVPGLSNVVAIAAGGWHSLALRADGTVAAWGAFSENFSAVPPGDLSDVVAIAAGEGHSLALLRSGTVRGWGDPFTRFEPPATLTNVTAIAAGSGFSLALRADGTVVAWGLGPFHAERGQLDVPAHVQGVRAIAAGGEHSLALLSNGTVAAWGANDFGQCTVPLGLTNVAAVEAGFAHSVALREDGTVVAWGDNRFGQVGRWSQLRNVTAVAAGGDLEQSHNLVMQNGTLVWSWGSNAFGELGDGTQLERDVPVQVAELSPAPSVTEPVPFELYTPLR